MNTICDCHRRVLENNAEIGLKFALLIPELLQQFPEGYFNDLKELMLDSSQHIAEANDMVVKMEQRLLERKTIMEAHGIEAEYQKTKEKS